MRWSVGWLKILRHVRLKLLRATAPVRKPWAARLRSPNNQNAPVLRSLLAVPVGPSLLPAGMPGSDDRAGGGVARNGSDCSSCCRTLSPISRTLAVLLLLGWRLLLALFLLRC
jgi:hypothetical protein